MKNAKSRVVAVLLSFSCAVPALAAPPMPAHALGEAAEDLSDACLAGKTADARRLAAQAQADARRVTITAIQAGGAADIDLAVADDLLDRARLLCARGASASGALAATQVTLLAMRLDPPSRRLARRLVWFDYLAGEILLRSRRGAPGDRAAVERRCGQMAALWSALRPRFAGNEPLAAKGDALVEGLKAPGTVVQRERQGARASDFVDELEKAAP